MTSAYVGPRSAARMTPYEDLRRDRARDDNDAAAKEDPYRRCLSDFRRDKFPDHTLPFHLAARERTSGYRGQAFPVIRGAQSILRLS
jgi:hypothetical protein